MTSDGLQNVLQLFKNEPNIDLTAQLEAVKKKIDNELQQAEYKCRNCRAEEQSHPK